MREEKNEPTKTDKLGPVPMTKLIIHRVAPIPRSLILRGPTPLEAKPRSFRSFHITTTDTRFIVEREINSTIFLVSGQVEFGDNTGNNLVIQGLRVLEWEVLEATSKIYTPLTHDIVRRNFLRFGVVRRAPDDHIIRIGISFIESQSYR